MGQLRDTIAKLKMTEELLIKYQPLPVYTPLTPQCHEFRHTASATPHTHWQGHAYDSFFLFFILLS
jgi:hypothetical protein